MRDPYGACFEGVSSKETSGRDVPTPARCPDVHPAYFETRFRMPAPGHHEWPAEFVILSAHATTGESWPADVSERADRRLENELRVRMGEEGLWRVTGYSPTTGHAEPSWAAQLPFDEACDLGLRFRQDALYLVRGDTLYVSHCDERRAPVRVGSFRARLDAAAADGSGP
ncbi:MAG: DUF3293 domain-containing protein [Gemmatimonadota bacterium]|nr:DUF3293 domain-containing protein [Gemmatimonadota bacterium]